MHLEKVMNYRRQFEMPRPTAWNPNNASVQPNLEMRDRSGNCLT